MGFARKLGADAIGGNGSSTQPQGLYNYLVANQNPAVTTSSGSINATDIFGLYFALNRVYRNQPKAAWLMDDSVYKRIRAAKDSQGRPLLDVERDGEKLMGKPVYISPSVPLAGGPPLRVFSS